MLYNREFQDEIIETMNKFTPKIELSFTAIEGLPFNINAFDFVGLFDEEAT